MSIFTEKLLELGFKYFKKDCYGYGEDHEGQFDLQYDFEYGESNFYVFGHLLEFVPEPNEIVELIELSALNRKHPKKRHIMSGQDAWAKVGQTPEGYTIYRQPNGAGGYSYITDELGGIAWDTCLVPLETLLVVIGLEITRQGEERLASMRKTRENTIKVLEEQVAFNKLVHVPIAPNDKIRGLKCNDFILDDYAEVVEP